MWHPSDTNTTLYLYTITVVQTRLSIYITRAPHPWWGPTFPGLTALSLHFAMEVFNLIMKGHEQEWQRFCAMEWLAQSADMEIGPLLNFSGNSFSWQSLRSQSGLAKKTPGRPPSSLWPRSEI